ncbi:MAG: DUF1080 domain-containing protein [Dysgonamonadaceae bacterium]|jgi:HEAT repeat protein|nr:DUF1080 domain-containing protein [Dysgonamonadaceae bacterium]
MKKIFLTIFSALLCCGVMAQTPVNRTVNTIIADALAQLPAENEKNYNSLIKDLAGTGEAGILSLVKQLNAPGKGSNTKVEYALSGISHFVSGKGNENLRSNISDAYVKALKTVDIPEIKAFVISQLQIVGKDEAVDALAPLLSQENLSSPAARALAAIGTEKAGKALQSALLRKTGTTETQRNIVLAIGEAKIGGSEELLQGLLSTDDELLKKDVLYALSQVGSIASIKLLYVEAEKTGFGYEKTNATEAYIALLKNLPAGIETEKAASDLLKKAAKAEKNGTRIAALQIVLSIQKDKGLKTLQTALKDPYIEYRNAALDYFSPYANEKTYTELVKTTIKDKRNEVKTDLINWLGREVQCPKKKAILTDLQIGKESLVQTLIKQLENSDFNIKQATAKTLVAFGDFQAIPALAGLLTSQEPQVIALGQASLSAFKGDITPYITDAMPRASDKGKIAAVELLAQRKSNNDLKYVLLLIQSGSSEVKTAAYQALKDVVTEKDLTTLYGLLESGDKQAIAPVQKAIISAISLQPAEKQAEIIIDRINKAGDKKYLYYLPLAVTGDKKAIELITEGFSGGNKETKDAAFEALLNWKGTEAADRIYAVCTASNASAYFDRAIAAYIKLVSNPASTGENRLIFLRKAMEIAKTDAQKNDILKQIGQTGTYPALLYAGQYLDQPALKENAAQAVMNIALNNKAYTGENLIALLNKAGAALNNPDANYQRESIKKHVDEMPKEKGFVSIFNGKDLTGWKGLVENPIARSKMTPAQLAKAQADADERMRKDWLVENGLLAFSGKGFDNLCTEKQYGDFEMYIDWLLDPAGPEADAGIYLRGTPQVQIWDTARTNVGAQVGSGGLYNNQVNPSKPLKVADNKLGEWNTLYIKMIGDRVTVKLNGELVVDNIILENYWNRSLPIPAIEQIELQAHGSKVYYRDIYLKELERPEPFQLSAAEKKEGFKILFDGTNMHEWTGNFVDYKLENGDIVVDPTSNFGGNLYTKEEYANFVFRFEFQLTPDANNGLGIRTPMEGDAAYVGMELQILDSEAPVYKDLAPYQYHGSVYGIIPAKRGYLKPTGEWNYQEVIADGDHIKITLNGTVIVDGNIRDAVENGTPDHKQHPGLFNKTGHIGFLGHGSPLKFKNIRIKELK